MSAPETGRHQRNGHTLEMRECEWRCLQCGHWFESSIEAEAFWCGDDCTDKHPGQPLYRVTEVAR